jgi:tRNA threonylcarbamoyladenosine biosynthesis protein TsaB
MLALDTATDIASVAVSTGDRTVARSIRGSRRHAAQILPLVHEVLALAGVSINDIKRIIVGDGPGSFTGLRIGWAAAKGLAHERELPLTAIPSLLGAAHAAGATDVAACYDALRGQVFAAIYGFSEGAIDIRVSPGLYTIPELEEAAEAEPELAVGDGAERYRDAIQAWTGRAPVGLDALPPIAASLLALYDYGEARRPVDRSAAEPTYGRPAEAQVKWESRHGRPLPHPPR